jgi:tetratricopeptide (TPR) repeat protein
LEEALPLYSKACELAIRRSNCVSYGKALARLGRIAEAKSLLSAACDEDRASCADYAIGLDLAGRTEEAHDAARKAEAPPELIGALYSLAAHHALSGDRVGAIRYLRRFLEVGNADIGIANDPDLKSLHGDHEFEAIVTEIRKRIDS